MSINLSPQVESEFIAAAHARGVTVDELMAEMLMADRARRVVTGAEFNGELGRRLASLDRGETVQPANARARLQKKSDERRKPQS